MYSLKKRSHYKIKATSILLVVLFIGLSFSLFFFFNKNTLKNKITNNKFELKFDDSVTQAEKDKISEVFKEQKIDLSSDITVSVKTQDTADNPSKVIAVYVLTTGLYSPNQSVKNEELVNSQVEVSSEINPDVAPEIAKFLNINQEKITSSNNLDLNSTKVKIMPIDELTAKQKLLAYNQQYYLDNFNSGAIFRVVNFAGEGSAQLDNLKFIENLSKDNIYKVNMSGVTAFTRLMLRKLNLVNDPLYFSNKIGAFLADADLTHISNEVSFKTDCQYNDAVFCSDPRFIETIKTSGVDLVELTGNHNNDVGRQFNTDTINLYHSLGIQTFGGGLNLDEAKKYYIADTKGSKVAFLGYNRADSPAGGAIATSDSAGANPFEFDNIKNDIQTAKQQAQFVIVDVQYNECYAYPDGYLEYPICNLPIQGQSDTFHKLIDLGADMVVGTQAHQPQIYEQYKDKMIYYGLGNLYFDQTQWPGTERGIILTHYFMQGKLLQTKLTPTEYNENLQTSQMEPAKAQALLEFINKSR